MAIAFLAIIALMWARVDLFIALVLFVALTSVSGVGLENPGFLKLILSVVFILAVPASAAVCGALLDRFCAGRSKSTSFSKLGALVAAAALLMSAPLEKYMVEIAALDDAGNYRRFTGVFLALINNALFCGCISAFVIMCCVLLFEVGAQFLLHTFGVQKKQPISLAGLRIVLVFTLVTWSLHLIAGLYAEELSPTAVLSAFR